MDERKTGDNHQLLRRTVGAVFHRKTPHQLLLALPIATVTVTTAGGSSFTRNDVVAARPSLLWLLLLSGEVCVQCVLSVSQSVLDKGVACSAAGLTINKVRRKWGMAIYAGVGVGGVYMRYNETRRTHRGFPPVKYGVE